MELKPTPDQVSTCAYALEEKLILKTSKNRIRREIRKSFSKIVGGGQLKYFYSQFGEDAVFNGLFPKHYRGFYVDIGAYDPLKWSNTAMLYERNWTGINVDANSGAIARFRRHRPRDVNLHYAVSTSPGTARMYEFADHAINSICSQNVEPTVTGSGGVLRIVEVPAITINEILSSHLPAGQKIDFLSIDIEGMDYPVLSTLDFVRFAPDVICAEIHNLDFDHLNTNPTYALLRSHNYKMFGFCRFSGIFQRE